MQKKFFLILLTYGFFYKLVNVFNFLLYLPYFNIKY